MSRNRVRETKSKPVARATGRVARQLIEQLEGRLLLSLTGNGQPDWVSVGPGAISNFDNGAMEAIAADPSDPNRVFVGGVNGGVWRTLDASAASPQWAPLTDSMPTLSIGDVEISPLDGNTIFAGTGSYRGGIFGGEGGTPVGLLKSSDGGNNWSVVGQSTLSGRIRSVVPTDLSGPSGQVVLAAGDNGIFRSADGGNTFVQVGPAGPVTDMVLDPFSKTRVYAAQPGPSGGIFFSDDGGTSWTNITANLPRVGIGSVGEAYRIRLAASPVSPFPLFAAMISSTANSLRGMYRYNLASGSWVSLGVPDLATVDVNHEGQGYADFSMAADPVTANVVFIAGDVRTADGNASVYRYDANSQSWGSAAEEGANGTEPHADSRDMVFAPHAGGGFDLLEACDGGIYRLSNPDSPSRRWSYIGGTDSSGPSTIAQPHAIAATEVNSSAYDPLNNVYFAGVADNGTPMENPAGSFAYTDSTDGDGDVVAVDTRAVNNGSSSYTVRYTKIGANVATIRSREYSASNQQIADHTALLASPSSPGVADSGLHHAADGSPITFGEYVLNAVDPSRLLIGTGDGLFESTDRGNTITDLTFGGHVGYTVLSSGGRVADSEFPLFAYVYTDGKLFERSPQGGPFVALSGYHGGAITSLVVDPYDLDRAYATDQNAVYQTTDRGQTWQNITGNLTSLPGGPGPGGLRTLEVYDPNPYQHGYEVLLCGGRDGVFRALNPEPNAVWSEFGDALPNAVVEDLHYYPPIQTANGLRGDLLLAGTFGRGMWSISNAAVAITAGGSGFLDPTFNNTGLQKLGYRTDPVQINGSAIQPDGKIVLVGTLGAAALGTGNDFFITRLNSDGSLDTEFGGQNSDPPGMVRVDFNALDDGANAVAVLPNGNLLVVGYDTDPFTGRNVAFAQLGASGHVLGLGSTYFNGAAQTDDVANAIALQGDGMAVVAGMANYVPVIDAQGESQVGVLRLNPATLALDPGFGSGGKVTFGVSSDSADQAAALAISGDGKIVVAGRSTTNSGTSLVLARLDSDGKLDSTFGSGGVISRNIAGSESWAEGVAIQSDGKIVVGGTALAPTPPAQIGDFNYLAMRFLPDGRLDNSADDPASPFGTGGSGYTSFDFGGKSDDEAYSMAIQSDGKIVLGGVTNNPAFTMRFAVVRLSSNGIPDASFGYGGNGVAEVISSGTEGAQFGGAPLALDGDGRIVIAGSADPGATHVPYAVVARLEPGEYPFSGKPISVPGRVNAAEFDNGGPDAAYADTTADVNDAAPEGTALDSLLRPGSGVDLETDSDGGDNAHVAFVRAGESLNYTISLPATAPYGLEERVASRGAGGGFTVLLDGVPVLSNLAIPDTGGFLSFQTISQGGVPLKAGTHVLQFLFTANGASGFAGNFKWFQVTGQPAIASLSATPNPVITGAKLTLTAQGVSDPTATVNQVSFYRESNGVPGIQTTGANPDLLVGSDTSGSDGWTLSDDTSNLAPGVYTYYAFAFDDHGGISGTASTQATVIAAAGLSGRVVFDANANGALDAGEGGLSGWTVYLDTNGDGIHEASEPAVTTDATGAWAFSQLSPGTYTVRTVPVPGWQATAPAGGKITRTLAPGANSAGNVLDEARVDLRFAPAAAYPTGDKPVALAVADLNHDGKLDVATANSTGNDVSIYTGRGDGTFAPGTPLAVGANPVDVVAADFNHDGNIDLAVADQDSNDVRVDLGNGDGTFSVSPILLGTPLPNGLAAADLNADGVTDLVVSNRNSKQITVFLSTGAGRFAAGVAYASGAFPSQVVVADVNSDGKPDLLVVNGDGNETTNHGSVSVLRGNGAGGFGPASDVPVSTGPEGAVIGDFTGDGNPDLLTANPGSAEGSLMIGRGGGAFSQPIGIDTGADPDSIGTADLNGDGIPDVATADFGPFPDSGNTVAVLTGNGDGTFALPVNFAAGDTPIGLKIADVNGDGLPDVVVASRDNNQLLVFLNRSHAAPIPGNAVEVLGARYQADARQALSFTFSSDVAASLSVAAVTVKNLDTGASFSPSGFIYDSGTNTVTFLFSGSLPDGHYRAALSGATVADGAGRHLDGDGDGTPGDDYLFEFSSLLGDLNGDHQVNFEDLLLLAQHFGKPATFAQGDLNDDGTVNFADLLLLAQHYGHGLS